MVCVTVDNVIYTVVIMVSTVIIETTEHVCNYIKVHLMFTFTGKPVSCEKSLMILTSTVAQNYI